MQGTHMTQQMGQSELETPIWGYLDSLSISTSLHSLAFFKLNLQSTSTHCPHLMFFSPPYSKHHFSIIGTPSIKSDCCVLSGLVQQFKYFQILGPSLPFLSHGFSAMPYSGLCFLRGDSQNINDGHSMCTQTPLVLAS